MSALPMIRYESPLEEHRLTATLVDFRHKLEVESEETVGHLELNAAMLLDDLCRFIGLTKEQRAQVLGKTATSMAHLLD